MGSRKLHACYLYVNGRFVDFLRYGERHIQVIHLSCSKCVDYGITFLHIAVILAEVDGLRYVLHLSLRHA